MKTYADLIQKLLQKADLMRQWQTLYPDPNDPVAGHVRRAVEEAFDALLAQCTIPAACWRQLALYLLPEALPAVEAIEIELDLPPIPSALPEIPSALPPIPAREEEFPW